MARRSNRGPQGTLTTPGGGSIDQAPQALALTDDQGRVVGSTIKTVLNGHHPRWARTRERAENCRLLLAGDIEAPMPKNFKLANADAFRSELATTYTRAVGLLSTIQKKKCQIKRNRATGSDRSNDVATEIEQIMTAVMFDENPGKGYPWPETCDIVLNDSLGCVITQPAMTFWEQPPELRDADGQIRRRYQRDKDNRVPKQVGKGFRLNRKKSVAAYEEDKADWYARNVPILFRAFGPQQVTPILGPGQRLDAVIVSSRYQRTSEISRRFIWGEGDHLSPVGASPNNSVGGTGEVELLEYWGTDSEGKPYVSYCVDGLPTYYRDTGEAAVQDLSPYISRLPVSLKWGQHWPGQTDVDQRGLPFMQPFYRSILNTNAILTGITTALWWAGFPTYATQPDPAAPPEVWNSNDRPPAVAIEPLKVIETPGPVTRLSGSDVSRDAYQVVSLMLGDNKDGGPSEGAQGKGGGSGFEKTIARAYSEDAQFQVLEGIRELFEDSASFALEILTNISEKHRPVLVYYSGPVVSFAAGDRVTSTRVMLELDPDLAGDNFRLTAEYPPSMSLAERQQSAELVERRLKSKRQHFEDDGDPSPERTVAEIEAEDLVASPIGQEQRWATIARLRGDDLMAEKLKLIQQQRVSQGGIPFAILQGFGDLLAQKAAEAAGGAQGAMPQAGPGGLPMPQGEAVGAPQGGQLTGLGGASSAQASLAGAVGGAMGVGPQNAAAAAGGQVPQNLGA